ncbi:hypothetical protein ACQJBY_053977 [Aegilops geniculata]
MKAKAPGDRAARFRSRARGLGFGLMDSNLEPPPWPGDRGRVRHRHSKGRTWRDAKCVLAKLSSHLNQWKILCVDNQAELLLPCIRLLDRRRGELLRIAWV